MTKSDRLIIDIAPVIGWYAVYAIRPEENKNNPVWIAPLALWALVEEDTRRYVVGLDCTLDFCDQGDNFLGYLAPGEKPEAWKEEALRFLHGKASTGPWGNRRSASRRPGQHR